MKKLFTFWSLICLSTWAIGQQALDDFNRTDNATVGGGWTEASTDAAENAEIISNQLVIGTGATSGRDYVYQDVNALYETTFDNGSGTLIWEFNMRSSRSNPSGFDGSNYGMGFILGGSNSDITMGDGYAVVLGQSGTDDRVRLVKYTGGIDGNSNLTDIITGTTDYGTDHLSVRVTYTVSSNGWELFVRDDGTSFSDPSTLAAGNSQGTATNSDLTGTDLIYVSCFFNHASGASDVNEFDNINIPSAACTPPTTQASSFGSANIAATTADISCTRGNGDGGLLILAKQGSAVDTDPTNGTTYSANAAFGSGDQIGTGNFVVFNGTASGASSPTGNISITGLTSGLTYHFAFFEYNSTGTCYNDVELVGNLTTTCSTPTEVTSFAAITGNTQVSLSWNDPTCFDEVLIIASTASITGTPTSADGSAYTANAAYGSGSSTQDFSSPEFPVFKGTGNSVTVTALTNGTTYSFKAFTRKGSSWSSGTEISAAPSTRLFIEDFDDNTGSVTTTYSEQCNSGVTDYFGAVCLSGGSCGNTVGAAVVLTGGDGGTFLGAQDTNGACTGSVETVLFDNINVSGASVLYICFQVAEDDDGSNQDWDTNSEVYFEVDFDNSGSFGKVLQFSDNNNTNTEPGLDFGCDGVQDGTAITSTFTTYCVGIDGSGSTMDLRITVSSLNDGDEDIAIDQIEIYDGTDDLPVSPTAFSCAKSLLPIQLTSFSGEMKNSKVDLTWETKSELNNDYFDIEYSRDGVSFEAIGKVKGQGNSYLPIIYSFTHPNPITGMNYYRLRQVDFDGKFEYSNIISINNEQDAPSVSIYPNPFKNELVLEVEEEVLVEVFNAIGQKVLETNQGAVSKQILDFSPYENGYYFLKITGEGFSETRKVLKMGN